MSLLPAQALMGTGLWAVSHLPFVTRTVGLVASGVAQVTWEPWASC